VAWDRREVVLSIDQEGLRHKSRLYVHLSEDLETAATVYKCKHLIYNDDRTS